MPILRKDAAKLMNFRSSAALTESFIKECLQADYSIVHDGKNEERSVEEYSAIGKKHCAAVLIPLIHQGNEWSLLFTRRTEIVEKHKGQVSFPGGACEQGEIQAEETALREAWEEIGVSTKDVKILGKLKVIETITDFLVTPVVGIIPWPYQFTISTQEVSRVFTIPIKWLIQPSNWEETKFTRDEDKNEYRVIRYRMFDGEILWGVSARITHNFLKILNLI